MEISSNPQEINFGTNDELNNQPFLTTDNLITTLNIPDTAETNYIPISTINQEAKINEIDNNIIGADSNQINNGETPYTFNGQINFESNFGTSSQVNNNNLDLFINNNQTTNTQIVTQDNFEAAQVEDLGTNFNTDNINTNTTNIPGTEGDYTFDGNLFNLNNMPAMTEENYSDNANVFHNFNFEGNNNINNDYNNIDNTNNLNYEQNNGFSSNTTGEYFQNPNTNNQLMNQFTFGEKEEITPPVVANPVNEFTENQNVYHEINNEQPKIENDILNLNTNNDNNNLLENEKKENENILEPNNKNEEVIKDSLFPNIQESKTFILKDENLKENDNQNQEQKKENELDTVPEVKISEKKTEEINTIILPNDDNQNKDGNEIQLTNNITDNVDDSAKVEEKKVEENKLVDISDEIKEIKEMPEKPFEQRDVIFNKNNIKVIKIEDDETQFCTGLLTPLFKKLFG